MPAHLLRPFQRDAFDTLIEDIPTFAKGLTKRGGRCPTYSARSFFLG